MTISSVNVSRISGLAIAPWAAGPEWAFPPRLTPKRPRFSRPAATQGARQPRKGGKVLMRVGAASPGSPHDPFGLG
jgi:hypothetical protein